MWQKTFRIALAGSCFLVACDTGVDDSQVARIETMEQEVRELRRSLDSIAEQVTTGTAAWRLADSLRWTLQGKDLATALSNFAILDPAVTDDFHTLRSRYGPLTFSVASVGPQADGSRLVLLIGNLTTATIEGGTLRIQWGPRADATRSDEWLSRLLTDDFSFTERLEPGAWNEVPISLPRVPPQGLGHLRISILELPSIVLSVR